MSETDEAAYQQACQDAQATQEYISIVAGKVVKQVKDNISGTP